MEITENNYLICHYATKGNLEVKFQYLEPKFKYLVKFTNFSKSLQTVNILTLKFFYKCQVTLLFPKNVKKNKKLIGSNYTLKYSIDSCILN